jgi:hypothetical protein
MKTHPECEAAGPDGRKKQEEEELACAYMLNSSEQVQFLLLH